MLAFNLAPLPRRALFLGYFSAFGRNKRYYLYMPGKAEIKFTWEEDKQQRAMDHNKSLSKPKNPL